jgi:hypothetical protein
MKTIKYKIYENQPNPYVVKISNRAASLLESLSYPNGHISGGFKINRDCDENIEIVTDSRDMRAIVELIEKGVLRGAVRWAPGVTVYKKQEVVE